MKLCRRSSTKLGSQNSRGSPPIRKASGFVFFFLFLFFFLSPLFWFGDGLEPLPKWLSQTLIRITKRSGESVSPPLPPPLLPCLGRRELRSRLGHGHVFFCRWQLHIRKYRSGGWCLFFFSPSIRAGNRGLGGAPPFFCNSLRRSWKNFTGLLSIFFFSFLPFSPAFALITENAIAHAKAAFGKTGLNLVPWQRGFFFSSPFLLFYSREEWTEHEGSFAGKERRTGRCLFFPFPSEGLQSQLGAGYCSFYRAQRAGISLFPFFFSFSSPQVKRSTE